MVARRRRQKRTEDTSTLPKTESGTIKVHRAYDSMGTLMDEVEGVEDLEVKTFVTEPSYISVNHGRTINLGNYESARIDVRISVPCYQSEIPEALLYADKLAYEFMEDSIKEYVEEIK